MAAKKKKVPEKKVAGTARPKRSLRDGAYELLRKSEEKYRNIFDNAIEGIYQVTPEGRFISANLAAARILGYDSSDELMRSVTDKRSQVYAYPEDRDRAVRIIRETGVLKNFEVQCRHKNGSIVWVSLNVKPIRNEEGTILYHEGTSQDITLRKQAEEALRVSEERFRHLSEAAFEAIAIHEEGILLNANDQFFKMFGYEPGEVLGKQVIPMTVAPEAREFMIKQIATGEEGPYESIGLRKDGTRFPMEIRVRQMEYQGRNVRVGALVDITERKRAEVEFLIIKKAVESSSDAIGMSDPQGHHFYQNKSFTNLFEYTADELEAAGGGPVAFSSSDIAREVFDAILNGRSWSGETDMISKSGRRFPVLLRADSIKDDVGKIISVFGTFTDITERKRMEDALRETNEYLHKLIDFANAPIIVWDPAFRITRFNEAFENLAGRTEQEILGQKIDILFPAESREASLAVIKKTLESERGEAIKIPILVSDGSIRIVLWNSANILTDEADLISTIAQGIDITELERAQEYLKKSEERYRAVVDDQTEFICRFAPDGTLTFVNDAYCRYFGLDRNVCIGKLHMVKLPPEDNRKMKTHLASLIPTNPVASLRHRLIMPSGEVMWQSWSDRAIFDKRGAVVEYQSVGRDITHVIQAEEALRAALAEKEVLLQEIHHRVKNNLAGIISLIDLQIGSLTDPARISQFKDLEIRIRSMALVHESLYLTEDIARINMVTYTENLTRHLFQVYETATEVRCRIDMGVITLPIETAIPCGLVMSEIVTNSLKYAFPPTFSCGEVRGEPCTITLALQREGNDYLFKIADNGIGIPEGIDVTMTHSLGLYLTRFIVKHQLRGSLEISTARGTVYTIRFPEPAVKERHTDE